MSFSAEKVRNVGVQDECQIVTISSVIHLLAKTHGPGCCVQGPPLILRCQRHEDTQASMCTFLVPLPFVLHNLGWRTAGASHGHPV